MQRISVKALGVITKISGSVESNIYLSGNHSVITAVERLTGLDIVSASDAQLYNFRANANEGILKSIQSIQDSGGVRILEDADGNIAISSRGVTSILPYRLYESQATAFDEQQREASIINAVIIGGQKYTDTDSVSQHNQHLHEGSFGFAKLSDRQSIASDLLSLYAQPYKTYKARYYLPHIAGKTDAEQIAFLNDVYYGNEKLLDIDGKLVEALHVSQELRPGLTHWVTLTLRERGNRNISLSISPTLNSKTVQFAGTLPSLGLDSNPITGYIVQYRLVGSADWIDIVTASGNGNVSGQFAVPQYATYEARMIATNGAGHQQISLAQTFTTMTTLARPSVFLSVNAGGGRAYWSAVPNATSYEYSWTSSNGGSGSGVTTSTSFDISRMLAHNDSITVSVIARAVNFVNSPAGTATQTFRLTLSVSLSVDYQTFPNLGYVVSTVSGGSGSYTYSWDRHGESNAIAEELRRNRGRNGYAHRNRQQRPHRLGVYQRERASNAAISISIG